MSSRRRLGVVLLVDPPHSTEIDGLRRAIGDRARLRIPPHVTLVPPVNVREASVPAALGLVRAAASSCGRPLRLTLGPPATWLPANPVLYLGVGGDLTELRRLRDGVFAPPLERPLAWPWVPHVTLADEADPSRIAAAVAALDLYQAAVTIEWIVLLEERRPAGGASTGGASTGGPSTAGRGPTVGGGWATDGGQVGVGNAPGARRWVPIADAALAPAVVVGRGGFELTLVQGRLLGPDALDLLSTAGRLEGAVSRSAPPGEPIAPRQVDSDRGAIVLSALADGELVGTARAWRSDAGGQIAVIVAPGRQRAGVGRQLLAHTEDAVRRAGWACPVLHASGPPGFYAACSRWSRTPP